MKQICVMVVLVALVVATGCGGSGSSEEGPTTPTPAWAGSIGAEGVTYAKDTATWGDGSIAVCGDFDTRVLLGAAPSEVELVSASTAPEENAYLARYRPDGSLLWAVSIESSEQVVAKSLGAADGFGLVCVGTFSGDATFSSVDGGDVTVLTEPDGTTAGFVARYTLDGTLLWVEHVETEASGEAECLAVSLRDDGLIAVGGRYYWSAEFSDGTMLTSDGWYDAFLATFSATGDLVWALTTDAQHEWYECWFTGVSFAPNGDIALCGTFSGEIRIPKPDDGPELLVSDTTVVPEYYQYEIVVAWVDDADGSFTWARQTTSDGDLAAAYDISVTGQSGVAVVGAFDATLDLSGGGESEALTSEGGVDGLLGLWNSEGTLVWAQQMAGLQQDSFRTIKARSNGDLLVAGFFQDETTLASGTAEETTLSSPLSDDLDGVAARYTASGVLVWIVQFTGNGSDVAASIAQSDNGTVVVGHFDEPMTIGESGALPPLVPSGDQDAFLTILN